MYNPKQKSLENFSLRKHILLSKMWFPGVSSSIAEYWMLTLLIRKHFSNEK